MSSAKLFVPICLLLTGWFLMHFLARRNERKIRSQWEGLLRDAAERMLEAFSKDCWGFWTLPDLRYRSWGNLSRHPVLFSRAEMPDIIPFVCSGLFDYLPVRCWVCNKLILKNVNYRKDDVQHFLEETESRSRSPIKWLPRPYCSRCHLALSFERYDGRKVSLTRKR